MGFIFLKVLSAFFIFFYFQLGYLWAMIGVNDRAIRASTSIDHLLPVLPFFIIFYMGGYFFPFVYVMFEKNREKFYWAVFHYITILSVSFGIFKVFPIEMVKTPPSGDDFFSRLTYSQQVLDSSFNNFPSLHVSMNLFTFLLLKDKVDGPWRILCGAFAICVAISTLFVKQHLIVDVMGGVGVATLAYYCYERYFSINQKRLFPIYLGSISFALLFILSQYKHLVIIFNSLWRYINMG